MKIKRIISLSFAVLTAMSVLIMTGCSSTPSVVISADKEDLLSITQKNCYDNPNIAPSYRAYADIVVKEAAGILSEVLSLSEDDALGKLISKGYRIESYCDPDITEKINSAVKESSVSELPVGCAVTDNKGHLLAVYGSDNDEKVNLATNPQLPYSTVKPLCVYAPAIEEKVVNWSTVTEDSPYKQITDDRGEVADWPQNATGEYENKGVSVYDALRRSLNTIAVKTLSRYGVTKCIEKMTGDFSMPLDYEYQKAISSGEEEVIGNIAMGYTYEGFSPVMMAGYYSVFATGGSYTEPKAVKRITSSDGSLIYENKEESKKVFSDETACVMNHLLRGVTLSGGTGTNAYIDDAFVAGKTGTGTSNDGHWFSGVVPQYSCAVWHGGNMEENYSPALFHDIVSSLPLDPNADYPYCPDVTERVYCKESGLLAGAKCADVEIGYYFADDTIGFCKEHQ